MNKQNIHIKKCGKTIEVDFDALPEHVRDHVVNYGLRQILNDCHSSEKDPDNAFALVEKKLEALKAGTLKAGRAAADPFGAWLRSKLVDIVQDKLGSTKKAAIEYLQENCGSTSFDWLDSLYEKDRDAALEKFRAAHERELAAAKKDLDVLGDISL